MGGIEKTRQIDVSGGKMSFIILAEERWHSNLYIYIYKLRKGGTQILCQFVKESFFRSSNI